MIPTVMPEGFRPPDLTSQDHCDICGYSSDGNPISQAFVRATKNDLDLLFCGHHYDEQEIVLLAGGWAIIDCRHAINVKPGG